LSWGESWPGRTLIDLGLIAASVFVTGLVLWGIANQFALIDQRLLMLLIIVPQVATLRALLRRHCYPNTGFWQLVRAAGGTGSISPTDAVPSPAISKAYVAFLNGAQAGITIILAYVVLSRTWYAANVGPPQTSFVHDLVRPWSVPPIHATTLTDNTGKVGTSREIQWWVWPVMGVLIFPLFSFALCGSAERTTQIVRHGYAGIQQSLQSELSGARVAAVMSVLLFWVPLLGLLAAGIAFWINRRSAGWTYRVSLIAFVVSALIHLVLLALFVLESA
jgi:hypothetical protein